MTHYHITSWLIAVLLFFAVYYLHKHGKVKLASILHVFLRITYFFVLATGFFLVSQISISFGHLVKTAIGALTVGFMEIILVHQKKGETYKPLWVICMFLLGAALLLGFYLPLGIHL
ncbi:DUF1516 family protein [Metabacillus sp. KIGAM252]|uniref:DUF1516 family protein n=1 Tax=Metabacillus flavus TaxID=2823519 RepID=A0ABS5LC65_9BACI|nr:DUF1516 family protein [Metabacillus flavus]MBS2968317.1 DUF1516 family protein [Metabacillus flavus]